MNTEMVKTIGGTWPLVGLVVFFVLAVLYRPQLSGILDRLTSVGLIRGETEVKVEAPLREDTPARAEPLQDEGPEPAVEALEVSERTAAGKSEREPATPDEWREEMVRAFLAGELERGEEAYGRTQEREADPVARLKKEAMYQYLRFRIGDTDALVRLERLAERTSTETEASVSVAQFLGMAYETGGSFASAGAAYEAGAARAPAEYDRSRLIASAAKCLYNSGEQEAAFRRIGRELGTVSSPDARAELYVGLAALYQKSGDQDERALALDKAVEAHPNDTKLRFDTAWAYSNSKPFGWGPLERIALMHYDTVLGFDPKHAAAWNNVGVSFERLEMPMYAVDGYSRASGLGNALASANLAHQYMGAGFAEDADRVLSTAGEGKRSDPDIARARAELTGARQQEAGKRSTALERAREERNFLLHYAEAYFVEAPIRVSIAGEYTSEDFERIEIREEGECVAASWQVRETKYSLKASVRNRALKVEHYTASGPLSSYKSFEGFGYVSPIEGASGEHRLMLLLLGQDAPQFLELNPISD